MSLSLSPLPSLTSPALPFSVEQEGASPPHPWSRPCRIRVLAMPMIRSSFLTRPRAPSSPVPARLLPASSLCEGDEPLARSPRPPQARRRQAASSPDPACPASSPPAGLKPMVSSAQPLSCACWASKFRPVVFFFCCGDFRIYPGDYRFAEKPLNFMHIITHKWCIGLK